MLKHVAVYATITFFACKAPMHAGSIDPSLQKILVYSQTSGAGLPTLSYAGAYLVTYALTPGEFDNLSVTYPGPASPVTLAGIPGGNFGSTQDFATQADMDAAYPFGTYTFVASNSVTLASDSESIGYTQDAYANNIPMLDPSTFTALLAMDPSQPFTFDFNSFTANPDATESSVFFEVVGGPGGPFYSFSPNSAVLPANTLAPATTYFWGLDFGEQIAGTDPISGNPNFIDYELETFGSFTTASGAPEPTSLVQISSAMLAAAGLYLGLKVSARRRVA